MALWMLIISNGILWVEHYFHGQRSSVNLFVAQEDSCSSHQDESDSCCAASCSCHHEDDAAIPAPYSDNAYPLFAQALENCCFESTNWMQLEETAKPDLEFKINTQLAAILIHWLISPELFQIQQDVFLENHAIPLPDSQKHLLYSVFLC